MWRPERSFLESSALHGDGENSLRSRTVITYLFSDLSKEAHWPLVTVMDADGELPLLDLVCRRAARLLLLHPRLLHS